ncbi:MAG: hypothetical protein FJX71_06330 [Alphaproteobacteria bacterium]|nr:hypothetical protein [Alphaproteobacteria bacterium]
MRLVRHVLISSFLLMFANLLMHPIQASAMTTEEADIFLDLDKVRKLRAGGTEATAAQAIMGPLGGANIEENVGLVRDFFAINLADLNAALTSIQTYGNLNFGPIDLAIIPPAIGVPAPELTVASGMTNLRKCLFRIVNNINFTNNAADQFGAPPALLQPFNVYFPGVTEDTITLSQFVQYMSRIRAH